MKKDIQILLVEDNEGDIVLTLEVRKEGIYKNMETPDLILLDINLPKVDGMEVLTEIKNDVDLMIIPVVMLTTSDSERDIMEAYQHHCNCFITKPVDFDKFIYVLSLIHISEPTRRT